MRIGYLILVLSMISIESGYGQLNVQLLHQLVNENKQEHSRQDNAKKRQATATANEQVNKTQMTRLKEKYRQIKKRFHTLGAMVDAAQIGLQAAPVVSEIIDQHELIFGLAQSNPALIPLAFDAEKDLADRSKKLIKYLYGLLISTGDINQMKTSDRKILFGHVLSELRLLAGASKGLAMAMYHANYRRSLNPFSDFINEDKRLVEDIIRNAAILKN